jgi:large subunit ribosomal protein L10
MVASPLTGLVTSLNGLIAGLGRQLQQIADQGLVGGAAPAEAPAAEAEAPAAEEPAAEEPAAEAAPEPEAEAPAAEETPSDTENQED